MNMVEAILNRDLAAVRVALDAGEDVHQGFEEPLFVAVKCSNLACVKLLIEHGADVNARGGLIGFVAVAEGDVDVLNELLGANARNTSDRYLYTLADMALIEAREAVVLERVIDHFNFDVAGLNEDAVVFAINNSLLRKLDVIADRGYEFEGKKIHEAITRNAHVNAWHEMRRMKGALSSTEQNFNARINKQTI